MSIYKITTNAFIIGLLFNNTYLLQLHKVDWILTLGNYERLSNLLFSQTSFLCLVVMKEKKMHNIIMIPFTRILAIFVVVVLAYHMREVDDDGMAIWTTIYFACLCINFFDVTEKA